MINMYKLKKKKNEKRDLIENEIFYIESVNKFFSLFYVFRSVELRGNIFYSFTFVRTRIELFYKASDSKRIYKR